MSGAIEVDISSMVDGLKKATEKTVQASRMGILESGEELLRVSRQEVPHDEGSLQGSGTVDPSDIAMPNPSVTVGYNKVYAARLHEHPEFRFQKGRKGKYLEDPLRDNRDKFAQHVAEKIKSTL